MVQGKKKQYFAGANTAFGFYSLFDYITRQDIEQLFILKGGPGSGKSTLMKSLGNRFLSEGYDVEFFHCSSDSDSLDGVKIPSLKAAVVDGTSPHVIDPALPGVVDEIVNLGEFWDSKQLRPHREAIETLAAAKQSCFAQAYQYLKEAHAVIEKHRYLISLALDREKMNQAVLSIIDALQASLPESGGKYSERQLFASAICPSGLVNFYPTILGEVENLYILTGEPGTGKSYLLERVYEALRGRPLAMEIYRCAFDPHRLDAVVIPAINTAFVKGTYPHSFAVPPLQGQAKQQTIAVSRYLKVHALKETATERALCQDRFWQLIGKAQDFLAKARQLHGKLEEYYVKAVDFSRVNQAGQFIYDRIKAG